MTEVNDKIISIQRIPSPTFESIDYVPPVYSEDEISHGEINLHGEPKIDGKKRIIKKKKNKELRENSIYDELLLQTKVNEVNEVNEVTEVTEVTEVPTSNPIGDIGSSVKSNPRVNKYKKRCN